MIDEIQKLNVCITYNTHYRIPKGQVTSDRKDAGKFAESSYHPDGVKQ